MIKDGERGNCLVRENQSGKLVSLVYGKPVSYNPDPVEKKPLYHFLPGEKTFSIGTAGCNLHCKYCQNWEISQCKPEIAPTVDMMPEKVIKFAKQAESRIISYTYSEPTVFYEYMFDTSKLAKKSKMRNVYVSNGFINQVPLKKLIPLLDAANIDLKGNKEFYKKVTGSWIEPVLETLKELHKKKVWIEVTNLIIPTLNDSEKDIKWLVDWIADNLDENVPLHLSAFWPTYKMNQLPSTTIATLKRARKIAMKKLNYVYTGNLPYDEGNTTYCPKCKKAVIKREGFHVTQNLLKNGKCPCGEKIPGVWN